MCVPALSHTTIAHLIRPLNDTKYVVIDSQSRLFNSIIISRYLSTGIQSVYLSQQNSKYFCQDKPNCGILTISKIFYLRRCKEMNTLSSSEERYM